MSDPIDDPRRLAIAAIVRIDDDGAYANVVLPKMLGDTTMEARDKGFATELGYGSTRMKRRLDHLVDRFLRAPIDVCAASARGSFGWHFHPHALLLSSVFIHRFRLVSRDLLGLHCLHRLGPGHVHDRLRMGATAVPEGQDALRQRDVGLAFGLCELLGCKSGLPRGNPLSKRWRPDGPLSDELPPTSLYRCTNT